MSRKDKVLVVEDQEDLKDLLQSILEENGLSVLTASDGIEAVEVFTAHKDEIGVVLSDIGLPRLGGWDAFLKMKEIDHNVRGILASGYFNPNVEEDIVRSGADYFVQKPYNSPAIVAMIHELLKGKK